MSAPDAAVDESSGPGKAVARWRGEFRANPSRALVAVDFDGVLSPIVDDPERAYALPEAVRALAAVGARIGQVAVVTGRPAEAAVRLGGFTGVAGLERLVVLGQYGVERWDAASGEFTVPPAPEAITRLRRELPGVLESLGLADLHVEDKGRALGVHTRRASDPDAALRRITEPLTDLAERLDLAVEPGKNVIELRAAGFDKGGTLTSLVEEVGATSVAYAGDDLGDLAAYEAVESLCAQGIAGLKIYSASDERNALADRCDLAVDGPAGVARWLGEAAELLA